MHLPAWVILAAAIFISLVYFGIRIRPDERLTPRQRREAMMDAEPRGFPIEPIGSADDRRDGNRID